jgi:hypothetical protein
MGVQVFIQHSEIETSRRLAIFAPRTQATQAPESPAEKAEFNYFFASFLIN